VKEGLVSFLTYANVLFVIVFVRTVVPRLLLVSSMDDFLGIANELGIPSRQTLLDVLDQAKAYDILPKVGFFTLAFIFEKLTFISELWAHTNWQSSDSRDRYTWQPLVLSMVMAGHLPRLCSLTDVQLLTSTTARRL